MRRRSSSPPTWAGSWTGIPLRPGRWARWPGLAVVPAQAAAGGPGRGPGAGGHRRILRHHLELAGCPGGRKKALAQAARADAVNRFFIDKLLLQASPTTNPDARTVSLRAAIDRASDQVAGSFSGEPETEAAIRLALGQAYHELGELDLSEAELRRALELLRAHESSPGLDQIQTMIELGHILSHMRREGESEALLRQATELTRSAWGQSTTQPCWRRGTSRVSTARRKGYRKRNSCFASFSRLAARGESNRHEPWPWS